MELCGKTVLDEGENRYPKNHGPRYSQPFAALVIRSSLTTSLQPHRLTYSKISYVDLRFFSHFFSHSLSCFLIPAFSESPTQSWFPGLPLAPEPYLAQSGTCPWDSIVMAQAKVTSCLLVPTRITQQQPTLFPDTLLFLLEAGYLAQLLVASCHCLGQPSSNKTYKLSLKISSW